MLSMINRVWTAFVPPTPEKHSDAIRLGILGAANIAPLGIITPAKSHPEVIVQAIAARDRSRAVAFAKKHGIPEVKDSYQEILDDKNIDAIYIPLANSFHFEWAVRSIRAGKHVLIEKPIVNNAAEAEMLFSLPELSLPNAPVVLEAFHNRFHPAVQLFQSFITPADVVHVYTDSMVPKALVGKDSIAFNYDVGGGTIIQIGVYNFAMLRTVFGAEPEECLKCETNVYADGVHDLCDYDCKLSFLFPNGGIGEVKSSLQGSIFWKPSEARVTHNEKVVEDKSLLATEEKVVTREVTMHGFFHSFLWHRIDVKDTFVIRNKGDRQIVKKWVEFNSHKAYTFKEAGGEFTEFPGEDWWMSFRFQLEEFVNRIKGRQTQYWIPGKESIAQMKMVDMAYEKSGLGLRPTSNFR